MFTDFRLIGSKKKGADLEKSKLELDEVMPLNQPVVAPVAVAVQEDPVRRKIDACTPEALVYYSCNPNYDHAENLWKSIAVTFLDWSTNVRRGRYGAESFVFNPLERSFLFSS
jgi:hypothetical protein